MKKRILKMGLLIGFALFFVAGTSAGCKKKAEIKLSDNAYIAETSSGDVVINLDEDGNPIEMIDANGDVIDLTNQEIEVKKDEKGNIVSVKTAKGETVTVKEKASEETAKEIVEKAVEKASEKGSEKGSEKKMASTSEKEAENASEENEKEEEEKFKPGENAPELSSEKKVEKSSEKASEKASETPSEKPAEKTYTEEKLSLTMYPKESGGAGTVSVFAGPGSDYGRATDMGNPASIACFPTVESFPVSVLGKTDNGWYHISYTSSKAQYAYQTGTPHTIEGYVLESDLVSEDAQAARVDAYHKKLEEQKKKAEEEQKKKEEKSSEKPSETPSAVPTPEEMEKINEQNRKEAEEQNNKTFTITASANRAVFDQINAYREENGLEPLQWGTEKEGIASTRASEQSDLVCNKHGSIDHGYGTPVSGAAENLTDISDAFSAWKSSGGHNQNMLGDYDYCVVYTGYADGGVSVTVALFWWEGA